MNDDEAVVSNGRVLGNALVPGIAVGGSKLGEPSAGEPDALQPVKTSVQAAARAALSFMASRGGYTTCWLRNQRWSLWTRVVESATIQ